MQKGFMLIAVLFILMANILGAFGTHTLKGKVDVSFLNTFQTGVQYHFYHSLALLALSILMFHVKNQWLNAAGIGFILGCILFSGSLYALSITGLRGLGMITPCGGLAFIMGWLLLFIGICKVKF
ncbi:DUF423 domain-containing protein [Legionella cardiaca]|uniref:DUF423 domain-containing protein n=1 Tax=Legionella cardiaca TaxID=1071983 RepID=A0ABY8AZP2_9GAMM|nr:DUF423 domain-containing protein [Legionella cardiaca]WED44592.1 DUF423 domain-containing protein [Legionella cardiaca]